MLKRFSMLLYEPLKASLRLAEDKITAAVTSTAVWQIRGCVVAVVDPNNNPAACVCPKAGRRAFVVFPDDAL
jgi:hypothetical protein